MRNVRVHRQNRGATIDGQPQTDGAQEYTHCLQFIPSYFQFLVVLRGKNGHVELYEKHTHLI